MVPARRNDGTRPGGNIEGRVFLDDRLVRWQVFEFQQVTDGAVSLIFESANAFRRVRYYGADWRALSDADLSLLSWRT